MSWWRCRGLPEEVGYSDDISLRNPYYAVMRTTLTIEEDIAVRIRELRRRRGHSLKQVINRLLREGLRNSRRTPEAKPYRTNPHRLSLRPGFDAVGFNQLADELEAEERRDREIRLRQ